MKPLLILRVNVGSKYGGVIPLNIYHDNDQYFKEVAE